MCDFSLATAAVGQRALRLSESGHGGSHTLAHHEIGHISLTTHTNDHSVRKLQRANHI
jgi:hypothetical protein